MVEKRRVANVSDPPPSCSTCDNVTRRQFSSPRWNMFVTWEEAYEWAGKVVRGEEKVTPDKGAMHI